MSEKKAVVKREVTPEHKLAMMKWIPISTDPIDRFTPDFIKESLPREKWPVVYIRKPGTLELIGSMERVDEAIKAAKAKSAVNASEEEKADDKVGMGAARMVAIGKAAIETWRTRVEKFENVFANDKTELVFQEEKGKITDACLNMVPWQLLLAVHFRYDELFGVSDLEREGLG